MANIGFVYVLQHDLMPGLYKVGMTHRSPTHRALELSSATGVPGEFNIACYVEVDDPSAVERYIHDQLGSSRISGKEFFMCPLDEIICCLKTLDDIYSFYFSDIAQEAMSPGSVNPYKPLWFESCLHDPERLAEIIHKSLSTTSSLEMGVIQ